MEGATSASKLKQQIDNLKAKVEKAKGMKLAKKDAIIADMQKQITQREQTLDEIENPSDYKSDVDTVATEGYKGPRYTYGMTLRPLDINTTPKGGQITGSYDTEDKRARHGSVQYARKLTQAELKKWDMVPLETKGKSGSSEKLESSFNKRDEMDRPLRPDGKVDWEKANAEQEEKFSSLDSFIEKTNSVAGLEAIISEANSIKDPNPDLKDPVLSKAKSKINDIRKSEERKAEVAAFEAMSDDEKIAKLKDDISEIEQYHKRRNDHYANAKRDIENDEDIKKIYSQIAKIESSRVKTKEPSSDIENLFNNQESFDAKNQDVGDFLLPQDGNKGAGFDQTRMQPEEAKPMNLGAILDEDGGKTKGEKTASEIAQSKQAQADKEGGEKLRKESLEKIRSQDEVFGQQGTRKGERVIVERFANKEVNNTSDPDMYASDDLEGLSVANLDAVAQDLADKFDLTIPSGTKADKMQWIRTTREANNINKIKHLPVGEVEKIGRSEGYIKPSKQELLEQYGDTYYTSEQSLENKWLLDQRSELAKEFPAEDAYDVMRGKKTWRDLPEGNAKRQELEKASVVREAGKAAIYSYVNSKGTIVNESTPATQEQIDKGVRTPVSTDAIRYHDMKPSQISSKAIAAYREYISNKALNYKKGFGGTAAAKSVEEEYDSALSEIESGKERVIPESEVDDNYDDMPFSKDIDGDEKAEPMTKAQSVKALMDAMAGLNKSKINVKFVNGGEDNKENKGWIDKKTGQVFVNLDIVQAKDMQKLLVHEDFVHGALQSILGDDGYRKLFDDVKAEIETEGSGFSKMAKFLVGEYDKETDKTAVKLEGDKLIDEVIAHWYQEVYGNAKVSPTRDGLIRKVTQWFHRKFAGQEGGKPRMQEIAETMDKAFGEYLKSRESQTVARDGGASFSKGNFQYSKEMPEGFGKLERLYVGQNITAPIIEGLRKLGVARITKPEEAAKAASFLAKKANEELIFIATDKNDKPVAMMRHSIGAANRSGAYLENLARYFAHPRMMNATGMWMAHNHPSGTLSHSPQDIDLLRRMKSLLRGSGVDAKGSVVMTPTGNFASYNMTHMLEEKGGSVDIKKKAESTDGFAWLDDVADDVAEIGFEIEEMPFGKKITSPNQVKEIYEDFGQRSGIAFLSQQNQAIGLLPMTEKEMMNLRDGRLREVFEAFGKTNATAVMAFTDRENATVVENIKKLTNSLDGIRMLDGYSKDGSFLTNNPNSEELGTKDHVFYSKDITNTKAFKDWFGDSKVVDENGEPLVVYHGTKERFTKFKLNNGMIWFTDEGDVADVASDTYEQDGGNVMPVHLKMDNPYFWKESDREPDRLFVSQLKKQGYDGIILPSNFGNKDYVVFDPTQIKSATGNSGSFDPNNPDIRYSKDLDEAYLELAKDPEKNEIKLQKMVDAEAEKWAPDTHVRYERDGDKVWEKGYVANGPIAKRYHGGPKNIRKFSDTKRGSRSAYDPNSLHSEGIWTASYASDPTEEAYSDYDARAYAQGHHDGGEVYPLYLDITNPASVPDTEAHYDEYRIESLKAKGYDGAKMMQSGMWVAFEPHQVKSAAPVTYDDDGNVIPLSRRFKDSDDIRFSKSIDTDDLRRRIGALDSRIEKAYESGNQKLIDRLETEQDKLVTQLEDYESDEDAEDPNEIEEGLDRQVYASYKKFKSQIDEGYADQDDYLANLRSIYEDAIGFNNASKLSDDQILSEAEWLVSQYEDMIGRIKGSPDIRFSKSITVSGLPEKPVMAGLRKMPRDQRVALIEKEYAHMNAFIDFVNGRQFVTAPDEDGQYQSITKSVRKGEKKWQRTNFDESGPSSHESFDNIRDAIETLRRIPENGDTIMIQGDPDDDTRYSKKTSLYSEALANKIGGRDTSYNNMKSRGIPLWERLSKMTKDALKILRQGVLDKYAPLMELDSSGHVYRLNRMSMGTATAINAFLDHGAISWLGNSPDVRTKEKGFIQLMKAIGEEGMDRYLSYRMGKRELDLRKRKGADYTSTFSDPEVDELIALADGIKFKDGMTLDKLNAEFNKLNDSVLDFAVEAGLIHPKMRAAMSENFYIPFYRAMDEDSKDDIFSSSAKRAGAKLDNYIKKIEGGKVMINDPLENIIKNWSTLIDQAIKNKARDAAIQRMMDVGLAKELIQQKDGEQILDDKREYFEFSNLTDKKKDRIVSHMVGGIRRHFRIEDEMMLATLTVTKPQMLDNVVMKGLRAPKRLLTYGATFGPAFKMANVIRDATSVALTHKEFNPFVDTLKGIIGALKKDQDYIQMMAAMGGFESGYVNEADASKTADAIRSRVGGKGVLHNAAKLLRFWEDIGSALENGTRLGLYKRRKGGDRMEAAFSSRDVMDFHLSGAADSVKILTALTPFLNARLQGLYKLGRAANENPARLMVGLSAIGVATALLWNLRDEEKWNELEDWDKWTYWHFWIGGQHFRIPKPFELSVVPNAVELMSDIMTGNEEMDKAGKFFWHTMHENFNLAELPAAIKPVVEQWANKSSFTKRAIVPAHLEKLEPSAQSKPWTSETLKMAGEYLGVSPLRAEALLKGYGSTITEAILVATDGMIVGIDALTDGSLGTVTRPAMGKSEMPMIGRFVRSDVARNTKYGTQYYEARDEIASLYDTVRHYARTGDKDKARELVEDGKWKLSLRKALMAYDRRLSLLRKKAKATYLDENLTPDEKKQALDEISQRQTEYQRKFYDMYLKKKKAQS